jgi:hypothetical protein
MATMKDIREWAAMKWNSDYVNRLPDWQLRVMYQNELIEKAKRDIERNKGIQISVYEIMTNGGHKDESESR